VVFRGGSETTESPKQSFSARGQTKLSRKGRERRYLPQTAQLGRQTPPAGRRGAATRGYQACLGAMCVEGGMWHVTYVRLFSKEIAGLCGGERSTLLRHSQSRYGRRKANRDQTGIKYGEVGHRSGPGEGFQKGFAESKEKVG
jgi:hypothetical protein